MTQYHVNVQEGTQSNVPSADPAATERRKLQQLGSKAVDGSITRELEELRQRAEAAAPVEQPVDPELVAEDERQLREARRVDTLSRMRRSSVLVQPGERPGSTKFLHDLEIKETTWGSRGPADQTRSPEK